MSPLDLVVETDDSAEPIDFDRILAAFLLRIVRTSDDDSRTTDRHVAEATS